MPRERVEGAAGALVLLGLASLSSCEGAKPAPRPVVPPPHFAAPTHGVSAGDVTPTRAIVWSRTDRWAEMHVDVEGGGRTLHARAWADAAHDFAAKVAVEPLSPGTEYHYRVWFSPDGRADPPPPGLSESGRFRTPPDEGTRAPVTFGWSGDVSGLNVCRDEHAGYPIFPTMNGAELDFFLGVGDMIYADQKCDARGLYGNAQIPGPFAEATTVREYWAHWRYNREDAGLRRFLSQTGYFAIWDDHEVVNDFGPADAWHRFPPYTIGADLVPLGRRALFDENPLDVTSPAEPERLYRAYRWGKHADVILLDTRSYRDLNPAPDTGPSPKTMLGAAQRAWFLDRVLRSTATWKFVVSSVPISIPTGRGGDAGHDGWANFDLDTGYERELASFFEAFRDAGVKNLVFLTTDVHFATGFLYRPFPDTPGFVVHEFTAGPLGAMLLPTHSTDETFHPERLFFFGPDHGPRSFEEAQRFMNWGKVAISKDGALSLSILDGVGALAAHVGMDVNGSISGVEVPAGTR